MSEIKALLPCGRELHTDSNQRVLGVAQATGSHQAFALPGLVDLAVNPLRGQSLQHWLAQEAHYADKGGIQHALLNGCDLAHSSHILDAGFDRHARRGRWQLVPALTAGGQWQTLADVGQLAQMGVGMMDAGDQIPAELDRLQRSLQLCAQYGLTVAIRPRLDALNGQSTVHRGAISERYGLDSQPALAETAALALLLELAADTGARLHFKRLSAARSVEMLAQAQKQGLAVSADVSIAQLCFCDVDLAGLDPRFLNNPPLRTSDDRDALREAVANGVISAVVSDHRCSARADALIEGLPGGQRAMHLLAPLMLHLAEQGVFRATSALHCISTGPAAIAGISLDQPEPGERFKGSIFVAGSEQVAENSKASAWLGWPLTHRLLSAG